MAREARSWGALRNRIVPRPTARKQQRILLLEDDPGVRRALHLMLRAHGLDVHAHEFSDLLLADPAIAEAEFLIADYRLPESNGIDVLRALRAAGWQGRAILITGAVSTALREEALAAGYVAALEKPLRPHDVIQALGLPPMRTA
jgi:FixJ family two-component response regulator